MKKTWDYFFNRHRIKTITGLLLLGILYWNALPYPLFTQPTSIVLEAEDGSLLGARIAADGQWRFPATDSLPNKYIQALITFEDKRFFYHPGFDPIGLSRAFLQNLRSGTVVSGGSTITMQTIRISRGQKRRTIVQKIWEILLATRLELGYSKKEILSLYAMNAPFGGNVVGLEAASWRYFGKAPNYLSWAEASMLAVLPNSPGLIHPGRNRKALFEKRNRLLDRLMEKGVLDSLTCQLAKEEAIPEQPLPLPMLSPHLLDRISLQSKTQSTVGKIRSTLDKDLQQQINTILTRHHSILQHNQIHNISAIVIEIKTGAIKAYIGNVPGAGALHQEQVDVVRAPRSTGSILKPLLYALALQEGTLLPNAYLPDIPTYISGYRPENFNKNYAGVIAANRALSRSLNIPMVYLLQQYGLEKFHHELRALGFQHIQQSSGFYGLPLILGGAEASLEDITAIYAGLGRILHTFEEKDHQYLNKNFVAPHYCSSDSPTSTTKLVDQAPHIGAAAAWFTLEAMQEVERPNSAGEWTFFRSSQKIAWKTGTSFGFRDAWAVGLNPRYAVGVWVGNADGEGRPGLIGVQAAAPILFDIFSLLPSEDWFIPPYNDMVELMVCKNSGHRATRYCAAEKQWMPTTGNKATSCPYHEWVHLDASETFRVHADCEAIENLVSKSWFVLPPVEEHYFQSNHPMYQPLPPIRSDCRQQMQGVQENVMQLIYPSTPTKIYLPTDLDGKRSKTIFTATHKNPAATIHWHIDNTYIGHTQQFHSMELAPAKGTHTLILVDQNGNRMEKKFKILN